MSKRKKNSGDLASQLGAAFGKPVNKSVPAHPANWKGDGVDHINTSVQATTMLGKLLNARFRLKFRHPIFGDFASLENYINFLRCPVLDDSLRTANLAKYNRKWITETHGPMRTLKLNKAVIVHAVWLRVISNPQLMALLKASDLPFDTYVVPHGEFLPRRIQAAVDEYNDAYEIVRSALKAGNSINLEPLFGEEEPIPNYLTQVAYLYVTVYKEMGLMITPAMDFAKSVVSFEQQHLFPRPPKEPKVKAVSPVEMPVAMSIDDEPLEPVPAEATSTDSMESCERTAVKVVMEEEASIDQLSQVQNAIIAHNSEFAIKEDKSEEVSASPADENEVVETNVERVLSKITPEQAVDNVDVVSELNPDQPADASVDTKNPSEFFGVAAAVLGQSTLLVIAHDALEDELSRGNFDQNVDSSVIDGVCRRGETGAIVHVDQAGYVEVADSVTSTTVAEGNSYLVPEASGEVGADDSVSPVSIEDGTQVVSVETLETDLRNRQDEILGEVADINDTMSKLD